MAINHIFQKTLEDIGMSHEQAATKVGRDTQWIGRRVRGESKITVEDLRLLSAKLGISANRIVDLPHDGVNPANTDPVLIDTVLGFVTKACDKAKVKASKRQKSAWATFAFTAALDLQLDIAQTEKLVKLLVRSSWKHTK
jgi:hypothetical protein